MGVREVFRNPDLHVSTLHELATVHVAELNDGTVAWVESLQDQFLLQKSISLTDNGITIIQPLSGSAIAGAAGAAWTRLYIDSGKWLNQQFWFISPATGNDENDGSQASPLRTHAELIRRVGMPHVVEIGELDVKILDDLTEDVLLSFEFSGFGFVFYFADVVPIFSGTITARINWNAAAGQEGLITDAGLPVSWTASGGIGRFLQITSGPNQGAEMFVVQDQGAKQARITPPQVGPFNDTPAVLQVGNPYTVFRFVHFGNTVTIGPGFGSMGTQIAAMNLDIGTVGANGTHEISTQDSVTFLTSSCRFAGVDAMEGSATTWWNSLFLSALRCEQAEMILLNGGMKSLSGPTLQLQAREGSRLFIGSSSGSGFMTEQGTPLSGGLVVRSNANVTVNPGGFIGVFDTAGAAIVEPDALLRVDGFFFGKGVTAVGFQVMSTGAIVYSNPLNVLAPAVQTLIGGTATAYGALPFINPTNNAKIVLLA